MYTCVWLSLNYVNVRVLVAIELSSRRGVWVFVRAFLCGWCVPCVCTYQYTSHSRPYHTHDSLLWGPLEPCR